MRVKSQVFYYYDESIFWSPDPDIVCESHFGRGASEIWCSTEKWAEENEALEGEWEGTVSSRTKIYRAKTLPYSTPFNKV